MKTAQCKSNPESVHHSIVNHEKQSFFTGQTHSTESFFSPVGIQPKLKIGSSNDQYERQADRVAEAVVSSPAPNIQQQSLEEEETLQRKCAECEKEEGLQMKSDAGQSAGIAPSGISQKIQNAGGGSQLPEPVNNEMSQKIGADFSNVNLHTGPEASILNQSLGARAFTHGNNVFFNSGEYNPGSREGKRLLAHELTHVVQQSYGAGNIQRQEINTTEKQVKIFFNAFIPGSLGTWLDEPGTPHCDFKSDERSFGQRGSSRISQSGELIISNERGIYNCTTNSSVGASHRRCLTLVPPSLGFNDRNMRMEMDQGGLRYINSTRTSSDMGSVSNDCSGNEAVFNLIGEAAYPFLPGPDIDFNVQVSVSVQGNQFSISARGERNKFPAYELILEYEDSRYILYQYMPTDTGPGIINLNSSEEFLISNSYFSI